MKRLKWLFEEEQTVLMWALAFLIAGHAADIFTTQWAMLFPGVQEANPLMRDVNLKFVLWKSLVVKAAYTLLVLFPLSWFLQKAFKCSTLSSFPFWWAGFGLLQVAFHNLTILVQVF